VLVIELPMRREGDLCEWVGLMGRGNDDLLCQRTSCGPARSLSNVRTSGRLSEVARDLQILPPNSHSDGISRQALSPTYPS